MSMLYHLLLIGDWEIPLEYSSAKPALFERSEQISSEGSEEDDEAHLENGGSASDPQSDGDTGGAGEEGAEYLNQDDVVCQEHRDHDTHHQQ